MTSHTPATHYAIVHEKTAQAVAALRELDLGAWLLMGRETLEMADPSLALVVGTTRGIRKRREVVVDRHFGSSFAIHDFGVQHNIVYE